MKKFLVSLLAVAMVLFSLSCGGGSGSSDVQTVGVLMPTESLQRWNQDGSNMKKELEAAGYKVLLQYANNDSAMQASQLENMVTQGVDILVIASIDGSVLGGPLQNAADAGIPAIAYDRLIMNTPNIDYYATFDNYQVGVIQGSFIEEQLGLKEGKGPFNIELFTGAPDDNNCVFFFGGAMDILRPYIENGQLVVKSGQVNFTEVATENWKSEVAQARMDNLLTANYADGTPLHAILSANDSVAIGVMAALKGSGYGSASKPFPILTGQDADKPNVVAIVNDEQSMSVFKDTRSLASQVVKMVDAVLQGKEVPVNDTDTYNNNVKQVPSYLLKPVYVDKNNYKELLIDTGYYTAADVAAN